eukprot:TRINITY_DN3010_c0_g1_i1.p1 TRINITY_DN3010_c0_g1~~TRINITY_DN3010_c0_g1_i1.p1  ORF type:complete len:651 (+),score=242.60 TRINITY_DN3010_c0_g1_i1:61-2013(+)
MSDGVELSSVEDPPLSAAEAVDARIAAARARAGLPQDMGYGWGSSGYTASPRQGSGLGAAFYVGDGATHRSRSIPQGGTAAPQGGEPLRLSYQGAPQGINLLQRGRSGSGSGVGLRPLAPPSQASSVPSTSGYHAAPDPAPAHARADPAAESTAAPLRVPPAEEHFEVEDAAEASDVAPPEPAAEAPQEEMAREGVPAEVVRHMREEHAAALAEYTTELAALRTENARLHHVHSTQTTDCAALRDEVAALKQQQAEAANAVIAAQTRHEEAWVKANERQEAQAKQLAAKDASIEKLKGDVAAAKAAAAAAKALEDSQKISVAKLNKKDKMIAEMRVALDKQQLERRRLEAQQAKQQKQYNETLAKAEQHAKSAKSSENVEKQQQQQQQDPEIEAILAQVDQEGLPAEGRECIARLVGLVLCGRHDVRRARLQYAKEKAAAAGIGAGEGMMRHGGGSRTNSPAASRGVHPPSRTSSPHIRRVGNSPARPAPGDAEEKKGESWQSWAERKRRLNHESGVRPDKAAPANTVPWRGGGNNRKPPAPRTASPSPAVHTTTHLHDVALDRAPPLPTVTTVAPPQPVVPAVEEPPQAVADAAPSGSPPAPSVGGGSMIPPSFVYTQGSSYRSASPPPGLISLVGAHRARPASYGVGE